MTDRFSKLGFKCNKDVIVVDPCILVTEVKIPSNAHCSTYFSTCTSKCSAWACNSGYKQSGSSCIEACVYENKCPGFNLNELEEKNYGGNWIEMSGDYCEACGITRWKDTCNRRSYSACMESDCNAEDNCSNSEGCDISGCRQCCEDCPGANCYYAIN